MRTKKRPYQTVALSVIKLGEEDVIRTSPPPPPPIGGGDDLEPDFKPKS